MTSKRQAPAEFLNHRWLRHKDDGFIYQWNEDLKPNHDLVEITEAEAFKAMGFAVPAKPRKSGKAVNVDMGELPDNGDSAE